MAHVDEDAGTVAVRRRLDPHPASVSVARRAVVAALDDLGRPELADDAALAVTELVTNALVHAGTTMELVVSHNGAVVLVEVGDDNPRLPVLRHHAQLAGTGRGLHLVQQLTTEWGARLRPPGKTVWFTLDARARTDAGEEQVYTGDLDDALEALLAAFPDEEPDASSPAPEERAAVLEVVLLDVPLLLHAAWQMQVDSILREYLLVRLGDADGHVEDELEAHAAVHEVIALLHEHIPEPDLGSDPEELMATAVEPLVSAERLVVPVPEAVAGQFDRMEAALDAAIALGEIGALLTPPTQPEVRDFRRWLCRQVREQFAGAEPQPWSRDAVAVGPLRRPPAWDPTGVVTSERGLLAAEDTNRIVALSPTATRILGYRSADELVGRRLVEIIPARFRQAHLAGFTLHLFAGRSPLLGQQVTVPALRSDGSEVLIDLLVEAVPLEGGRRVFVAELAEAAPASGTPQAPD